jgi:hypothetical protein
MHFLKAPPAWTQQQQQQQQQEQEEKGIQEEAEQPQQQETEAEGRLACPGCAAKIGKFSLTDGIDCSCGAEVREGAGVSAHESTSCPLPGRSPSSLPPISALLPHT